MSQNLYEVITEMRLKLLDLTARNRLINFKHTTGKSLPFVKGNESQLYQKLVESSTKNQVSILGLPEPTTDKWIEKNGRLTKPDPKEWAIIKKIPTTYEIKNSDESNESDLQTLMYPEDLAKHCRKLERESVLAIEETGANMLFLILGFLEYPDQRDSDKFFLAPLLCIPVSLVKKDSSGIQQFSIKYTGDDINENISLREKLYNDYGISMPELDDENIDVDEYFTAIEKVIINLPGFSIRRRVTLGLLNFSMLEKDANPDNWPTAEDGTNSLIDHEIIKEVFEGNQNESDSGLNFSEDHPVEDSPGAEIPLIYDADSSQHSALIDALSLKKNLVIEGPPGTGKSQTITNLIAAAIAEGKSVLFVAEKLAALEVVKTRLTMAGLDPYVLELHSNKTNKKRVLEEIDKRINFHPNNPADLPQLTRQLKQHRDDLKSYTDIINSISHNNFGLTLHKIMWRSELHRAKLNANTAALNNLVIDDATQISSLELTRRLDCLNHLSSQFKIIYGFDEQSIFWGFYPNQITPTDESQILKLLVESQEWSEKLVATVNNLSEKIGGNLIGLNLNFVTNQKFILEKIIELEEKNLPLDLIPSLFKEDESGEISKKILLSLEDSIKRYRELEIIVKNSLIDELDLSRSRLTELRAIERSALGYGVTLGSPEDIKNLIDEIQNSINRIDHGLNHVSDFCNSNSIEFEGRRAELESLIEFNSQVIAIPDEYIELQSESIQKNTALEGLESLSQLQESWTSVEIKINTELYLDALPSSENLKEAILTLRSGDTWYRVFQSEWRKAISLHKSLQKIKKRIKSSQRLSDLENILNLQDQKSKWENHPAWDDYLNRGKPTDPIDLKGYISIAKWNRSCRNASKLINFDLFESKIRTPQEIKALKRAAINLKDELTHILGGLDVIQSKFTRLNEFIGSNSVNKVRVIADTLLKDISSHIDWINEKVNPNAPFVEVVKGLAGALERFEIAQSTNKNEAAKKLLGNLFKGIETDTDSAIDVLNFGKSIDSLDLMPQIKFYLRSNNPVKASVEINQLLKEIEKGLLAWEAFIDNLKLFGEFNGLEWLNIDEPFDLQEFSVNLIYKIKISTQNIDQLLPWALYIARRKEASQINLSNFLKLLEQGKIHADDLVDSYAYAVYGNIIQEAFKNIPDLGKFSGLKHNQIRDEFKRLDREIIKLRGQSIAYSCNARAMPPGGRNGAKVDDKTEMVLLNYLIPQQRPRMPVRKMLAKAGTAIRTLKPCFMMGPQAVAQFLTPGSIKFDMVIMDEASQLKPEEAIGSIARCKQLIVVGDPKQLPPTSFFSRMANASNDGGGFAATDAESILEVCSSHFQPIRSLRWHYRSQHHSLIAFSNQNFYKNNLIIFPSPHGLSNQLGIKATYLPDAVYENQINLREAKRVVDAVVTHISTRPSDSLGIVTLNLKQRDLIAELLDERLSSIRSAEEYREYWAEQNQPLFIKNLENVQGDERDAIIISTTFGKPPGANVVRQNFGPISRQGGWRRLNVLFTRAKKSIALYTSLKPEDIVIDSTTPEGTKALRNYLEYARTGVLNIAEDTNLDPDSDFEISVMDMLNRRGFEVTPQLGVAGFRIDIAVKNPDSQGSYLAAIECDGASYHSALSVRDRDRIRQEILESLGWKGKIWRIWSTDWFRSPKQEADKLISFLEDLRKNWKSEHISTDSWIEERHSDDNNHSNDQETIKELSEDSSEYDFDEVNEIKSALIDDEDDLEVEVGDIVRYIDTSRPNEILTIQITAKTDDRDNGLVSENKPLAQCLLGAVKDDEVTLHLPSHEPRIFKIIEIKRV